MNEEFKNKIVKEIMENSKSLLTSTEVSEIFSDIQSKMYQMLLDKERDIFIDNSSDNKKNGYGKKGKRIRTKNGTISVRMPRDRKSEFNPIIIGKRQRVIDDFSDTAILLYSKGNSLEDIREIIKNVYKIELSKTFISELTSRVSVDLKEWQERQLSKIYPFMYVDCLYCPVKVEGVSTKLAVYVIIGINLAGKKEVVGIWVGDGNESASFWAGIFNELKDRGVEDILYISMDGLTGLKEAIELIYPATKTQRCIVHLVRNLYNVCGKKEVKEVIKDYKKIYTSNTLEEAQFLYSEFVLKYKNSKAIINVINKQIEHIYALFSESTEIRKLIYTTNTIESVNSCLRKVTRGKGMFINKESLMRVLFLRIKDLETKWSKGTKDWNKILNILINQYENRITKYIQKA